MKKLILIIAIFVVGSLLFAYVYGGTNFGLYGYPSFNKYKPSKPFLISYDNTVSEYDYNRYRNEVVAFQEAGETYIKNANNDIKRIQEAQNSVIKEINQAIDEFNSWARNVKVKSGY